MALPFPIRRGADRIYDELRELSELMPLRYGELFRYRWGLDTHFPHHTRQAAAKFEMSKNTVERMLNQSLWNITRWAHSHELPAIGELLGDDPGAYAERAWRQAEQRWGNQYAAFSEAVLLLSVGGLSVPDAHAAVRQWMVDHGLARTNKLGRPLTAEQRVADARAALDRILAQVIWPSNAARHEGLSGFSIQRPLPQWASGKSGVFRSEKLQRLVQFDSTLELHLLSQLDADPRVASYIEQPVELPFRLDAEIRNYTPDIAVQLVDGRVLIIEAKPLDRLGEFTNLKKWSALASWCEQSGLGWWVGSPQRSFVEHCRIEPDAEKHELVAAEVENGPVTGDDYYALTQLVGYEHLGLAATRDLLEWRAGSHVRRAVGPELKEMKQLRAQIWDLR
jgi:hypothetical protein